jgi:hypothetical protein
MKRPSPRPGTAFYGGAVERRNRKPGRPRLAGEAEGPQSVRPPGAENYPEPCPREKGTERRCRRFLGLISPTPARPLVSGVTRR